MLANYQCKVYAHVRFISLHVDAYPRCPCIHSHIPHSREPPRSSLCQAFRFCTYVTQWRSAASSLSLSSAYFRLVLLQRSFRTSVCFLEAVRTQAKVSRALGRDGGPAKMLRSSNPSASMQKTYDDCYLICSTAVYFEKQVHLSPTSCLNPSA